MRIVIDLQGAQTASRFRGIGRYSIAMVKAIVKNRGGHEILIALNGLFPDTIEPIRSQFDGLLPQDNIRVWYTPGPVREIQPVNTWRREAAELIREAFLASLQPDIVHIISLFEGYMDDAVTSIGLFDQTTPVSITLFDLIPLMNAGEYLKPDPVYKGHYFRKISHLRRASMMLSISEFTRLEALENLHLPDKSLINTYIGIDSCFCPLTLDEQDIQDTKNKLGITRQQETGARNLSKKPARRRCVTGASPAFVLYTGGSDARKNLPRLIRAYARLSPNLRNTHQLIIGGEIPADNVNKLWKEASNAGLRKNELVFTGYISDYDLIKLYNLCKLFVFPSWHEGFGLPVLEAMSCGAPVICSNTSSLPEVVGNSDALFSPYSEESICNKITESLTNEYFRLSLCKHGLEQAKKFTWDKSAITAISAFEGLYARCAGNHKRPQATHVLIDRIANIIPLDLSDKSIIHLADNIGRNQPQTGIKQLFLDVSELVQRDARTGIQRVVRSLLKELLTNPPDDVRVEPVYATVEHGYRYARCFTSNFLGHHNEVLNDEPVEYRVGDIFLGLDLQSHVVQAQEAFYQRLRRDGVHVQFVVYDLLCVLMPQYFPYGAAKTHELWLKVVTKCDGSVCISRAVADELIAWVDTHARARLRPFKISWFHLGADYAGSVPSRGMPNNASMIIMEIQKRVTFLMVGTIEPRKGHTQVLAAFEKLWVGGLDVNLVIVGKKGWLVEDMIKRLRPHQEFNRRLFWLEGISDEYLENIYTCSTCLIAASEGEGFGLPLIEAAKHKLPVIARDIPVFREVAGEHAFYFSGLTAQDLADSVNEWMVLYVKGDAPDVSGIPWLTWKESAEQLKRLINLM
ncbi:MAG: glycosyltransferase family 4 protein [Nitrospirae bacterium]|nr:glycosyltransferase family 4 protein [Nitrospirota bacterium]